MKTSNFSHNAKDPGAISIARSTPPWAGQIQYYRPLWPTAKLLRWTKTLQRLDQWEAYHEAEYVEAYHATLARLGPQTVWDDLYTLVAPHEPILLCWESPGAFCHRRLVAEWLQQHLGVEVPEVPEA